MRLAELEPRWIHANVFAFRCPHCRQTWLTCKNMAMTRNEQVDIVRAAGLEPYAPRFGVVLMRDETAWKIDGQDFEGMTVSPSIDASASGHWHGFIRNGEIC